MHEHSHDHGHSHDDGHHHEHSRSSLTFASRSERDSRDHRTLADRRRGQEDSSFRIFEALGAAEAKIHGIDIEKIHFHEVGAVDAIVDIVCAAVGIHSLGSR